MNLKGKVVNVMGDSITEGVGVSEQSKRYPDVFAELTVDGLHPSDKHA